MPDKFGGDRHWSALLEEQMQAHGKLFYTLAYGVLRDAGAAEDACQQALLKALQKPDALRASNSLRAWLVEIVMKEALQIRRRRKIEERAYAVHATNQSTTVVDEGRWELREAVLDAVENLPESIRTIIVMRILNGMPGSVVKDLLECSDSHVSREMHRGMELLSVVLKDWKPTDSRAENVE